jgi:DNA-binding CsgD family transcriptional regulator
LPSPLEKAFLTLSRTLSEVDDFGTLPVILQETIDTFVHVDWIGLYTSSPLGPVYNVTTNPHLPFNWDQLYQEISPYDNFRDRTISLPVGQALIYEEMRDPNSEIERYCTDYVKRYTDVVHMMGMPVVKDPEGIAIMGYYRSEPRLGFTQQDKHLIMGVGPLIATAVKTMLLHQKWELRRVAYDQVLEDTGCRPIFMDQHLNIIDLPLATLGFLREMFDDTSMQGLPSPLSAYIARHIAPQGALSENTGPWCFRIKASRGDVVCHAYVLMTSEKQPLLVLKVEPHGCGEDFSELARIGLTAREIETLSYLPLGYTNIQIAMAMGISAAGVKKHLTNLNRKLSAQSRTEILYRALLLKKNGTINPDQL